MNRLIAWLRIDVIRLRSSGIGCLLLTFLATTTFAGDDHPAALQHWAPSTLTHSVDVVSVQPPLVRQIAAGQE